MILIIIIMLIVAVFLIWKHYKDTQLLETVTPSDCGESSERKVVLELLKMGIDYRAIFHNCYIKKASGTYTQVDLVVATSQGLLAFEIKDYSGWIFGDFRQKYWTQILAYGKEKYRFYNPIMQNNGHIKAIRENLPSNPNIPIYSIIVFFGSCTLKNVTIGSNNDFIIYPNEINSTVQEIISRPRTNFGDKYEIMKVLRQAVANGANPEIVSSQLISASKAGIDRPAPTYDYTYNLFSVLKRMSRFR